MESECINDIAWAICACVSFVGLVWAVAWAIVESSKYYTDEDEN